MPKIKILFFIACVSVSLSGCSREIPNVKIIPLMDTFVRLEVRDMPGNGSWAAPLEKAAGRMRALEKRFNYFDGDSELAKLNSAKLAETDALSPEMRRVLQKAEELRVLTKGAFDVRIGPEGKIDLGGIAKGFIVDEGIRVLRKNGIKSAIINAGGDMYCMGDRYNIGIKDPLDAENIIATFSVKDKGVATSANYERPGHIVDPRTGKSALKKVKSATVIANDCMTADGLATALYVLSAEEALALADGLGNVECAIIDGRDKLYFSQGFSLTTASR